MTPAIEAASAAIKGGMTAAEAAATFGISAAVTAALYGIEHFVGEGRTTANTLTRGLQQDYTDQVLKPLAVINQTDPATAHALMEEKWPTFYQKFENFASQGKNQRKVVDQMYATPDWIDTVSSIMGRNPFTSQRQESTNTQAQTTTTGNDQNLSDGSADTGDNQQELSRQNSMAKLQSMLRNGLGTQQQQVQNTNVTNQQEQQLQNNVTNQQNYTSNTGTGTHLQDYNALLSVGSLLGNLFSKGNKATTQNRQDQAGPTTQPARGYGDLNITNTLTGGNVTGTNVSNNTQSEGPSQTLALLKMLGYNGPTASAQGAQPNTMDSMLQQLMQLGGRA